MRGADEAAARARAELLLARAEDERPWTLRELARATSCGGSGPVRWAILARDAAILEPLAADGTWLKLPVNPLRAADRRYLWTDDHASVFTVLTPR